MLKKYNEDNLSYALKELFLSNDVGQDLTFVFGDGNYSMHRYILMLKAPHLLIDLKKYRWTRSSIRKKSI